MRLRCLIQDNGFWFQTLALAMGLFLNKAYYMNRQDNQILRLKSA